MKNPLMPERFLPCVSGAYFLAGRPQVSWSPAKRAQYPDTPRNTIAGAAPTREKRRCRGSTRVGQSDADSACFIFRHAAQRVFCNIDVNVQYGAAMIGMGLVALAPGLPVLALGALLAASSAGLAWTPFNTASHSHVGNQKRQAALAAVHIITRWPIRKGTTNPRPALVFQAAKDSEMSKEPKPTRGMPRSLIFAMIPLGFVLLVLILLLTGFWTQETTDETSPAGDLPTEQPVVAPE